MYHVCQTSIKNAGTTTNIIQQWKRLEEQDLEGTNIRDLMIIDLAKFITTLHNKKQEIIVGIDANETNEKSKNGVDKLLHLTKLIDVISQKHGIRKESNIYIRGRRRIESLLCSEHIYTFIDKSGITSFNELTSFDHRGLFIDLRLQDFLKNSHIALTDHSSRPLQSSNTKNVIKYKRHLQDYVVTHPIIEQAIDLKKKPAKLLLQTIM